MDVRRIASLAALIGPATSVAVFLGEGWFRPGYEWWPIIKEAAIKAE
jgi:hypothetical protein